MEIEGVGGSAGGVFSSSTQLGSGLVVKDRQLKFRTLIGKARPPDCLFIGEALDQIGRVLYGAPWNQSPAFQHLPFQHRGKIRGRPRGFWRIGLENPKRTAKKLWELLPVPDDLIEEYLKAEVMFRAARDVLLNALYTRTLTALRHTNELPEIGKDEPGVWTCQIVLIFYTGYIRKPHQMGADIVLLKREPFVKWLAMLTAGSLASAKAVKRQLSADVREKIIQAVNMHVGVGGYLLYRDEFRKFMRMTLESGGFHAASSRANEIWDSLSPKIKMQRGHPDGPQTRKEMTADQEALKQIILDVISKSSPPPAQEDPN